MIHICILCVCVCARALLIAIHNEEALRPQLFVCCSLALSLLLRCHRTLLPSSDNTSNGNTGCALPVPMFLLQRAYCTCTVFVYMIVCTCSMYFRILVWYCSSSISRDPAGISFYVKARDTLWIPSGYHGGREL